MYIDTECLDTIYRLVHSATHWDIILFTDDDTTFTYHFLFIKQPSIDNDVCMYIEQKKMFSTTR